MNQKPLTSREKRKIVLGAISLFAGVAIVSNFLENRGVIASSPMSSGLSPATLPAIRVAFSPGDGGATAENLVITELAKAHKQVLIAAYEFTSPSIAKAVVEAKHRGVDVQAVLDKTQARTGGYSSAKFLADEGVSVRIDYVPAIMHDKFILIDGSTLETGSFNYTRSAIERNAENAIAIDDPDLVQIYGREFVRLSNEAQAYPGS
jgi:phosphatidylserine/phosphatidylglycerophosphate/cardiolipin synthase-like enzyme